MFLLIDNYDSFTYNLVQAFYSLGKDPLVCYNDDPMILEYAKRPDLEMVVLSPGPGRPEDAGLCLDLLSILPKHVPVLGVCLGHQILGLFGGGTICQAPAIMHGKQSEIHHDQTGLFEKLPSPMLVGRYHSLALAEAPHDSPLRIQAKDATGCVMALRYTDRPWVGVQFHPESVLTPLGMQLLANFPDSLLTKTDDLSYPIMLESVVSGKDLREDQAKVAFTSMMDGTLTPSQAASLLVALRMKGESPTEIAQAVRVLLAKATPIPPIEQAHIDVVGTGGDNRHSFNCSTATALTLAGMGYLVTKHGNRAVSSTCGSADALEGLGFPLVKSAEEAIDNLKRSNFTFLFAPHFHPAFASIAGIRREMGIRTLFNILGPLINPAKPSHILLGVGDPRLLPLMTDTLLALGQEHACVVMGAGVYDEITPIGPAMITKITNGHAESLPLDPKDFGIPPCTPQDLAVHSKQEAVSVLTDLLAGKGPAPMLDMIVLNVGVALHLLTSMDLQKAMGEARIAVRDGVGRSVLHAA